MILAFNTKAAEEIRKRIREDLKIEAFENALTFHSLAYQVVQPNKNTFCDNGEYSEKTFEFVQKLTDEIADQSFHQKLFHYFRKELRVRERSGFANNAEYFFTGEI
jgi:superfamily I DNA/RNA helicase